MATRTAEEQLDATGIAYTSSPYDDDTWDDTAILDAFDRAVGSYMGADGRVIAGSSEGGSGGSGGGGGGGGGGNPNVNSASLDVSGTKWDAAAIAAIAERARAYAEKRSGTRVGHVRAKVAVEEASNGSTSIQAAEERGAGPEAQANSISAWQEASESTGAEYETSNGFADGFGSSAGIEAPGLAPPAPGLLPGAAGGQDETLSKVLLSWYHSGYYTGKLATERELLPIIERQRQQLMRWEAWRKQFESWRGQGAAAAAGGGGAAGGSAAAARSAEEEGNRFAATATDDLEKTISYSSDELRALKPEGLRSQEEQ